MVVKEDNTERRDEKEEKEKKIHEQGKWGVRGK